MRPKYFLIGLLLFCVLVLPSWAQSKEFVYPKGYAEADGRKASMKLAIIGAQVRGEMQAEGVKGPNIRLPRTTISLAGTPSMAYGKVVEA